MEKHFLVMSSGLTEAQKNVTKELQARVEEFADVFRPLHERQRLHFSTESTYFCIIIALHINHHLFFPLEQSNIANHDQIIQKSHSLCFLLLKLMENTVTTKIVTTNFVLYLYSASRQRTLVFHSLT